MGADFSSLKCATPSRLSWIRILCGRPASWSIRDNLKDLLDFGAERMQHRTCGRSFDHRQFHFGGPRYNRAIWFLIPASSPRPNRIFIGRLADTDKLFASAQAAN
jgi:hypothetical protein